MDEDPIDTCVGCNLFNKFNNYCYEFNNINKRCPCRKCMVKIICQTNCEKLNSPFVVEGV